MKAGLYTYAWDLEAVGYDTAVGQIAEAGFTAVNLATSYHAGKFILPRSPKRRVYFAEDGSIYFNPDLVKYGRIRPRVNSMVNAEGDPVGRLTEMTRKHGLDYVAWTVCLHNSWIGERYPDVTMQTAFGDPQWHSLSPAHPDARAYLLAMVGDFASRYDVSAIELEAPGYMSFAHGYHHEIFGVDVDAGVDRLLGISFNPVEVSGATAAGIDAERIRLRVADTIDAIWNRGEPSSIADALILDPEIVAYGDWLHAQAISLAEELAEVIRSANSAIVVRHFAAMARGEQVNVADPVLATADELLSGYAATPPEIHQRSAAFESAGKPWWGMLRAIAPDFPTADGLADMVAAWRGTSAVGIDVYNYGLMTQPNFDALAKALRV
ncbi:MAG: hypothetical protein WKF81_10910 [Thermomicrobiales bacterium]